MDNIWLIYGSYVYIHIYMDNIWIIYTYTLVGGFPGTWMADFPRNSWEWNVIIPIVELIFFRGIETTNQAIY